jgi:exonuclease SbcD
MRLIHTSDWHLGRTFKNVGMLGVQERALDHLVSVVASERVDAVLVSGDIYDRAVPAPDAVALLSETLERLVDSGTQVVLSSGNHDSATRLGFAAGLLRRAGVHIASGIPDVGRLIQIGDVDVAPIPYLDPIVTADALGAAERTHAAVLSAAMDRVRTAASGAPLVVMAHAVVTGGDMCASERDISTGGLSAVPATTFSPATYAALGHLHGAQRLGEVVHYSGSPVAMSFGEARHTKSWSVVEIEAGSAPRVERIPVPVHRALRVLRGRIDDLLGDGRFADAEDAWCSVVLTDAVRPLGAMERLRARFPHTIELAFEPEDVVSLDRSYASRVRGRAELDICCDFVEHVRGGAAADDGERRLLRTALERSRSARAVREDEGAVRALPREVSA